MKSHDPKSISRLVEENCKRWELANRTAEKKVHVPVIAISREAGSLGRFVARRLCDDLGMDLYGSRIIGEIAKQTDLSEKVLRTLDEKGRNYLEDMVAMFDRKSGLVSGEFIKTLVRIVGTIERHGNGVILGRGAPFILNRHRNLRVRFIAPLEMRVENIRREFKLSAADAKREIITIDANRRAFTRQYFNVPLDDVSYYDLVINNEFVDLDASVEIVKEALKRKQSLISKAA